MSEHKLERRESLHGCFYRYGDKEIGPFPISEEGSTNFDEELAAKFGKPVTCGHVFRTRLLASINNNESLRINLVRNAITKNENLIPSKIADYLLSPAAPFDIVTFKDNKDLVTYDKIKDAGLWSLKGEHEIERFATETVEVCGAQFKEQLSRHLMAEVLAWLRWKTYTDRETFKSPPDKIPLLNGVYDLATSKLEPHRQENHFLYQVPVKYDDAAKCPTIDKFLEEVFGDRKQLAYEMAGYALAEPIPNKWQRAFMLVGPGDNGKSTFLNLLTALFGAENVSNQNLQALVENRFSVAALDQKLANIAADIGDRALFKTWQFKALTGGDRITAEHKFKEPYTFPNRSIQYYSCNTLPESYDDSDAFHKRWVIALFEKVFSGDRKDSKLLEKLTTPTELSGFLNKAIAAYLIMDARGTFTGEGTTLEKREYYTKLSDPVQCFIDEQVLFNPDGMVVKQVLYDQFRSFCQQRGYGRIFTEKTFFSKFREKAGDRIYDGRLKDSEGRERRIFRGFNLDTLPEQPKQPKQSKLGDGSPY